MHNHDTVSEGVKLAVRHPHLGAALFARTISRFLHDAGWFDEKIKARFCMLYVENAIDGAVENAIDTQLITRMEEKPIEVAIRFLKRDPELTLRVLVVMISRELKLRQKLSPEEERHFFDELVSCFFSSKAR